MTIEEAIAHARQVAESCAGDCSCQHDRLAGWLEELRRYKGLEEQGRLVVLPCKVGDTVYFSAWFGTAPHVVDKIIDPFFYTHDARDVGSGADFYLRDFGHSVFLTREEAEAALRGGTNDG